MTTNDFTPAEEAMLEQEFQALLGEYARSMHGNRVELITRAYQLAKSAHHGVRRLSGEPYMMHPLSVARIVVKEIGLGSTSICAALLHDVVEDTDYTVEDIERMFDKKIASIVEGLTKLSGGVFADKAMKQAENVRKLMLTMSDDIRVMLVKLADRLHNMRTLAAQRPEKQRKIAAETQYIYAPMAHRLGLFPIKTELEDLSFKYEYPELYAEIEEKLANVKEVQAGYFEEFAAPIHKKLSMMGYDYRMFSRNKSVYSIYKKMTKKGVPFEQIYDLLAARIVFEPNSSFSEKDQCWMIYSAITEIYRPHPERIRDWISMPKANGYEALHVTVMSPSGQWIEVQIRTNRMHELAEHGLAAHWRYKTGEGSGGGLDKWLKEIKDVLANPDPDAIAFLDTFTLNLFAHEVCVFTPKGDIRTLAQGATVLDLAYQLHSELGEHCIGAKVNRVSRPLSYILQSGDQVEILTSKKQAPEPEWLEIAVTAKAKDSIKKYFRKARGVLGLIQKDKEAKARKAKISICGKDSFGVLMRILNIICDHKANMKDLHVTSADKMFHCDVELVVFKQKVVSQICMKLRDIESVTAVNVTELEN
ncbi:MAG: bifunctional (p)ppGpp synthetase/guanosine-3',5'-bis(diphosphate) 3'-pyrophosphohydrolase [Paludibacteraceae bacterium]|nr:bifunctional (p)ppGpp synthetase/guanosine-3',5'-bis(diphosphate) 3'-pyrophosphohydrolase [Paludibacteraceae bacterium]